MATHDASTGFAVAGVIIAIVFVSLAFSHRQESNPSPRAKGQVSDPRRSEAPGWQGAVSQYDSGFDWESGLVYPTRRGERVRSAGEVRIANYLFAHGYRYEYEPHIRGFRPDFYLPDSNIIIEYWGMRGASYQQRRRLKTRVFLSSGYQLVSLEPGKDVSLERDLGRQLYYKRLAAGA